MSNEAALRRACRLPTANGHSYHAAINANTHGEAEFQMKKFLKKSLAVAALALAGSAGASVVTFEQPSMPFVLEGEVAEFGDHWLTAYSGLSVPGALVGAIINGAELADTCVSGMRCPVNNPTNFYAVLDDSYFYVERSDAQAFKLRSFDAGFIGYTGVTYGTVAGILILQGFDALGNLIEQSEQIPIAGPVGGQFNFNTYGAADFGADFADTEFNFVRVLGYACNLSGSCSRAINGASFGFDNITDSIADAAAVPEPASLALIGAAFVGAITATRRRRSV